MLDERIKYDACPLCRSGDIDIFATVDCTGNTRWRVPLEPFIIWMKCLRCDHVFTDGYFTEQALEVLFANTHDQQIVGTDIEAHRLISAKMVQRVVEAIGIPDDRLWLDVGFGNGSLLMTAKEFGFEPFGVDLRKKNVEDIGMFGIPAHHGTLKSAQTEVHFAAKPHVISMADVVEHEPFPIEALRSARELIADDGLLLISMPNAGAPLWHYWNATNQNPYWIEIEHYHNFTRESLYTQLEQAGFAPRHYTISERYRCCMEVLADAV